MRTFDEGEQHARAPRGRRVVEDDLDGADIGRGLTGETVVAPERAVVHGVALDHRAHGEPLQQLVADRRQTRLVADARRERRRDRDDRVTSRHEQVVGEQRHRIVGAVDAPHRL